MLWMNHNRLFILLHYSFFFSVAMNKASENIFILDNILDYFLSVNM